MATVSIVPRGSAPLWGYRHCHNERLWSDYVARLPAEPGLVVTETGERNGKWLVGGLRDALAANPEGMLREASVDPARVVSEWRPYQSLDPQFVLRRAQDALAPPATVTLTINGDRIVATGSAPSAWIQQARAASRMLPGGGPDVDVAQMRDLDLHDEQLWGSYVERLRPEPGIVVTDSGKGGARGLGGAWPPAGGLWPAPVLRDPVAVHPAVIVRW